MKKHVIWILAILVLSACKATVPEPYQKDREPEQRTEYNGLEGWAQSEKDRAYLMDEELIRKCDSAIVSMAIARSEKNADDIDKFTSEIERTCK